MKSAPDGGEDGGSAGVTHRYPQGSHSTPPGQLLAQDTAHLSESAALHEAELQLHPVTAFETETDAREWIDQSVNPAPIGF